jgi:hypothetical protein
VVVDADGGLTVNVTVPEFEHPAKVVAVAV